MDKEHWDSLIRSEKAVIAGHIGHLIIYDGERPITDDDMLFACQAQITSALYSARYKYDPKLYVERDIEQELNEFFDAQLNQESPNCYVLVSPAGSGKTNLLCHLAQQRVSQQPTLLLMGGNLYLSGTTGLLGGIRSKLEEVSPKFFFRSDADSLHTLIRLGEVREKNVLLLIDGINEYDNPIEMRKALEAILTSDLGNHIKLLITCRDYYWGLFRGNFWDRRTFNTLPTDNLDRENISSFHLFSEDAYERALLLYLEHYNVFGQPVGAAATQCRHPLLLRFFCEAYKDQNIGRIEDIRLKELFDRYWDQKLVSIADRMMRQETEHLHLERDLVRELERYLYGVASFMLKNNVRAISDNNLLRATNRRERFDDPQSFYGRIRDEFIILEEKELDQRVDLPRSGSLLTKLNQNLRRNFTLLSYSTHRNIQISFVYEEFMEYVMARSLVNDWQRQKFNEGKILKSIEKLTNKYDEFAQILGVMVYLALMLREQGKLSLWSLLLTKGDEWQGIVLDTFRKLPDDQIDNSVLDTLAEILHTSGEIIQGQVLEIIKLQKIGQTLSQSQTLFDVICQLTKANNVAIVEQAVSILELVRIDKCLPILIEVINRSIGKTRSQAKTIIEKYSEEAEILLDENNKALYYGTLFRINPTAANLKKCITLGTTALQALGEPLRDLNPQVRMGAIQALRKLDKKQTVPILIESLGDEEAEIRRTAVQILGTLKDRRALLPLTERSKDQAWQVRLAVGQAMAKLDYGQAEPILIEALKDSEATVRKSAVEILGKKGTERAVLPLNDRSTDTDFEVRLKTVQVLGQWGDERAVPGLISALQDSEAKLRSDAVEFLSKIGTELALLPLITMIRDEDEKLRLKVVQALGQWGDERALSALSKALHDQESEIRIEAVMALEHLGDTRAVPALINALSDSDKNVRIAVARALGLLGDQQAVLPLMDTLKKAEDWRFQFSAVRALGMLGDRRAVPSLIPILKTSEMPLLTKTFQVLDQLGGVQATPVLSKIFHESEATVRATLLHALAPSGNKDVIQLVIEGLHDENWEVRQSALTVLEKLADHIDVTSVLIEIVNASNPDVRQTLIQALGKPGNVTALPVIVEALQDVTERVQFSAIKALGELGDEKALFALLMMLRKSNPNIRAEAIRALGKLGNLQAEPAIIRALRDNYPSVRTSAAEALGKLEDVQVVPFLIESLDDKDNDVRLSIVQTLQHFVDLQTLPALREILEAEHLNSQERASKVFEKLLENNPGTFRLLIELRDIEPNIRERAINQLGKLGDSQVTLPLITALQDADPKIRKSAVLALQILGDPRAVIPIIEKVKDNHESVRLCAVRALQEISDIRSVPALIDALRDNYSSVRAEAVRALELLGDERAVLPLIDSLEDTDARVRESAELALRKFGML